MAETEEEKKEKEKKEKEKEKEREESWWSRLPMYVKIGGIALLALFFMQAREEGGNLANFFWYGLIGAAVLWLLGKGIKPESKLISPEEAERITWETMRRKKNDGQFTYNTEYWVGPNIVLQRVDAEPRDYLVQVTTKEGGLMRYKGAKVDVNTGWCTLCDTIGELTGRETPEVIRPLPEWWKMARKYGLETMFLKK